MTGLVPHISDERLAEMLAGLDGVTPGPWHEGDKWVFVSPRSGQSTDALEHIFRNEEAQANSAHVARCDPDTMRSIITELQYLRAQGGVRVKAQKWREESKGWFRAPSELGAYNITHYAGMKSEGFKLEYGGGFTSYFSSLEEAKAAAQADYERRILGSLEASPAPVSEGVTDQMVEIACKVFIPHWETCTAEVRSDVFGDMRSALTAALAAKGGQ